MSDYADTSLLLSLLLRDAHHAQAVAIVRASPGIHWTPWQKLETVNAARALIARGRLTPAELRKAQATLQAALRAGDLVPSPLPAYALWEEAERLSHDHTAALGVRTLDLLHVAAARVLRARIFHTFDSRQHALASAAGLVVNS